MKVKELINILSEVTNQELEVWIPAETGRQKLTDMYEYNDGCDNHVLLDGDY